MIVKAEKKMYGSTHCLFHICPTSQEINFTRSINASQSQSQIGQVPWLGVGKLRRTFNTRLQVTTSSDGTLSSEDRPSDTL